MHVKSWVQRCRPVIAVQGRQRQVDLRCLLANHSSRVNELQARRETLSPEIRRWAGEMVLQLRSAPEDPPGSSQLPLTLAPGNQSHALFWPLWVSEHTYASMRVHTHTHPCTYIHSHTNPYTHTPTHMHTHIYTLTQHTRLYTHTHNTHTYTHIHIHMCTHTCAYTHNQMYTHILKNNKMEVTKEDIWHWPCPSHTYLHTLMPPHTCPHTLMPALMCIHTTKYFN